ncbi:MAG TPA: hypothetical protein PKA05_18100 [Roseiflexaceae bacterium]|nr:hypothetical protein [Roseiflexaceae bacterium]HMP42295.1 hypothetical protein [Roseiflexaceae bacterium]
MATSTTEQRFEFPTLGLAVGGSALLLAIDDHLLPLRRNLCLSMAKPHVRAEPVLTPQRTIPHAPDRIATHFYGAVLQEQDRFRMWYYPVALGDAPGELTQGPVCYAESTDGLVWQRPVLGQMEFKGSRDNNAIALPETKIEGVHVIRDDDDPDPGRRYKMIYNPHTGRFWSIRTATSADGITWQPGPELPVTEFVEQASFYKHAGLYVVNAQTISPWHYSDGGAPMGRQAYAWVSPDFDTWLDETVESFTLPEPRNPEERGPRKPYDQVHIGIGAASFGTVLVGMFGLWHNSPVFHEITCDLSLVVSNDGLHFREPVKGGIFIAADESPAPPVDGVQHPTILAQGNGILNVGDETWIYHDRWRNAPYGEDYYSEVALATLPRDRWGALGLNPDQSQGSVWSAPFRVPAGGFTLLLNADGAHGMQVELGDESFTLLPAFSGEQSGRSSVAGGLDCAVAWPAGDTAALAGQRVRLRVRMTRAPGVEPRLYAMSLQ